MSRQRVSLGALGAAASVLLVPTAAQAATTFTVDAAAPPGCSAADVCRTINEANEKVANGDTVVINPGTYTEAVSVVKQNVTFAAVRPGTVTVVSPPPAANRFPAPVFRLGGRGSEGRGTVLRGLVISAGTDSGGSAVQVHASDTVVEASALMRPPTTGPAQDFFGPVYDAFFAAGVNTVSSSLVIEEGVAANVVRGGHRSSLIIRGSSIIGSEKTHNGIDLRGNVVTDGPRPVVVPNQILGSSVYTPKATADAIKLIAFDPAQKVTEVDSTVLSPGTRGAGLYAYTFSDDVAKPDVGAMSVIARHVTISGGARPFEITNAASRGGTITVDADRSILHGAGRSTVAVEPPVVLPRVGEDDPGTSATLNETLSDTVDVTAASGEARTMVSTSFFTPDAALFADIATRDLHLRPSAPVIDSGGPAVGGEFPVDFEGQGRVSGAASDLGGDEFVSRGPIAAITANTTTPRRNEVATFDVSGSRGRGRPGATAIYAFDFGDGTPVVTSATPKVRHAFATVGPVVVRVVVVDGLGAPALAATGLTVFDGRAPTVVVAKPKAGAAFKVYSAERTGAGSNRGAKRRSETLRKITFSGTVTGAVGVAFVELAIRRVGSSSENCVFLDGRARRFVAKRCRTPKFVIVGFEGGRFTYRLPKGPIYKPAAYELLVRTRSADGVVSGPTSVTFKLK